MTIVFEGMRNIVCLVNFLYLIFLNFHLTVTIVSFFFVRNKLYVALHYINNIFFYINSYIINL